LNPRYYAIEKLDSKKVCESIADDFWNDVAVDLVIDTAGHILSSIGVSRNTQELCY